MRPLLTLAHRWLGLTTAAFLFVTGLTGAVISWDHELDDWLNPHLHAARAPGPALEPLALADRIEARHPGVAVTYLPLAVEPGESLDVFVSPRVDPATGRLHEPGFNEVFVDPASGEELGRREWGAVWPITRETAVSFLYKLHYSLHLPEMWGIDRWGPWLLGGVAILWTVDCFVALYLTFPALRLGGFLRRWRPSWRVRTDLGAYRLNFDLHRASGLWTWALSLTLAFSAFSLNLWDEVFFPLMSKVSQVTPTPFDERAPSPPDRPLAPRLTRAEAVERAREAARGRGWEEPPGSIFHAEHHGIYGVAFFRPEDGHGAGGVGHREIYVDAADGRILGQRLPWKGTAADLFVQAQFPVHSGRILGVPGRILVSAMGLVVAALSVTGVYVWWRKRARRRAAEA